MCVTCTHAYDQKSSSEFRNLDLIDIFEDAMVGYEDTALELAFKETMNKAQQSLLYGNKNLKIEDFFSRVNLEDSYEVSGEGNLQFMIPIKLAYEVISLLTF